MHGAQPHALWQPRVGDGREAHEQIVHHGWFLLLYGRNQQHGEAIILQLKIKNLVEKKRTKPQSKWKLLFYYIELMSRSILGNFMTF